MAGDWIKMRSNLWDDPRVSRLCDLTDEHESMVVGGLYWLWSSADQHSEDGFMPGLTVKAINRKTGVNGLGEALVSIEWIAEESGGIRICRFDDHNGASAKRRCSEAKRKGLVRKTSASDADKVQTQSGSDAELEKEKEKEKDIKKEESPTRVVNVSPGDLSFAEYMFSKIIQVAPKARKPNLSDWANTIRLMREQDSLSTENIRDVFDWANRDQFWSTNILGPKKLREKFARLDAEMQKPKTAQPPQAGMKSTSFKGRITDSSWADSPTRKTRDIPIAEEVSDRSWAGEGPHE